MTYKSRPVFTFAADWGQLPVVSFGYDLHAQAIGFSSLRFSPTASYPVRGIDFSLQLPTDADVQAVEDFYASVNGTLTGFWIANPMARLSIAAAVDGTHFDIVDFKLRDIWTQDASVYLALFDDTRTLHCTKVTNVAASGGLERITIEDSLAVQASWRGFLLMYCRFAGDPSATWNAEGWQTRKVRVTELPLEYATAGAFPIKLWLYKFTQDFGNGTKIVNRFTSFDLELTSTSPSETWTPWPIAHTGIKKTASADSEETKIEAAMDLLADLTQFPIANYVPFAAEVPITVAIFEAVFSAPAGVSSKTLIFAGPIQKASSDGNKLTGTAASVLHLLDNKHPRFYIGRRCNWALYSNPNGDPYPGLCYINPDDWKISGNLALITDVPNQLDITATGANGKPENWFAFGYIDTGTGANRERQTILASSVGAGDHVTITIKRPLRKAVNGQLCLLYPGCDLTYATCRDKFGNAANFGGHLNVPMSNLTIQGVPNQNASVNKK